MARPKSKNPRRERRASYFTKDEAAEIDAMLESVFPQHETASDRVREALLEWLAGKKSSGRSLPGGGRSGTTLARGRDAESQL